MNALLTSGPQKNVDVLPVRVGNRVFPGRLAAEPAEHVSDLANDSTSDLFASMTSDLLACLPYSKIEKPLSQSKSPLVKAYAESVARIQGFNDDLNLFLRRVCEANVEFRQSAGVTNSGARDEALAKKLTEMVAHALSAQFHVKNVLDADVACLPIDKFHVFLKSAMENTVEGFTRHLFQMLGHLVDKSLVGIIEWRGRNACRYCYFRELVIQENQRTDVASKEVGRTTSGRTVTVRQEVQETHSGTHTFRHSRHEHDLMHAVAMTIGNSTAVIPGHIRVVADNVPSWLYPFTRIVQGTIIKQRIIEQDYQSEKWTHVSAPVVIIERTHTILHPDPAICVGPFVLVGWAPDEIAAELARRGRVAGNRSAQPWWFAQKGAEK